MALFQSGTYNLAAIAEDSRFRWGVTMPIGPDGRVSVTNGIAAAGNSATKHPDAVRQVLAWMGSARGNQYLGANGAAIPAVTAGPAVYFTTGLRGVDVSPFFKVLDGPRIPAPGGPGFPAGYQAIKPYFDEMFLGRRDVADTLRGGGRRERRRPALTGTRAGVSSSASDTAHNSSTTGRPRSHAIPAAMAPQRSDRRRPSR